METITIQATIKKDLKTVWDAWINPLHITKWNNASPDWHTPKAENDVRTGGTFTSRMEARDGSQGFDFGGTYTEVVPMQKIAYTMNGDDARKVSVTFTETPEGVEVIEIFDPENENPLEMQRAGWQAILDNFKSYTEALS
jgi:uncharacterized protein YndB with AHSA1/START domain